jgi:hypothetical protein
MFPPQIGPSTSRNDNTLTGSPGAFACRRAWSPSSTQNLNRPLPRLSSSGLHEMLDKEVEVRTSSRSPRSMNLRASRARASLFSLRHRFSCGCLARRSGAARPVRLGLVFFPVRPSRRRKGPKPKPPAPRGSAFGLEGPPLGRLRENPRLAAARLD